MIFPWFASLFSCTPLSPPADQEVGPRARYVAERQEIANRYAEWEITGPPEMREVDPSAHYFNPLRDDRRVADAPIGNLGPFLTVAATTVRQHLWVALVGFAT